MGDGVVDAIRRSSLFFVFAALILALPAGCATPQVVKDASKAQLKLLNAMNGATIGLQQGMDRFHTDQEDTIKDWARIAIATDAIDCLTLPDEACSDKIRASCGDKTPDCMRKVARVCARKISPDTLFDSEEDSIRPFIDAATTDFETQAQTFGGLEQKARIQSSSATDAASKRRLALIADNFHMMLGKVRLNEAKFPQSENETCPKCAHDRNMALWLLDDEGKTSAEVDLQLQILAQQISVMSQVASAIDQWLSIDVTLSQQQADQLDKTYKDAIGTLGTPK